jgi:predicted membrane protein DUF2142
VATQPFGGPDEPSHYLRALSIVNGKWIGPKVPYPGRDMSAAQLAFANHDTTAVLVRTPALAPYEGTCGATGQPLLRGSCLMPDPNGNFPPLAYLLPAAALSTTHTAQVGLWRMRIVSVVPALAFLLLAVVLLWDGTAWSVLGLLISVSPMVLYAGSLLNPSGLQITACLAFAAAALRIARAPASPPAWVWAALALSGAVAILAGPIGLEFALFVLLVVGFVLGPRGVREVRSRTRPRTLALTTLTLGIAGLIALIYTRIAGFSTTIGFTPILTGLKQGLHQLPWVLHDAVGSFATHNLPLPIAAEWIWLILALGLLATAIGLGSRRERGVVALTVVLGFAFPVLFYAWVDRFSGFTLQGREILPVLMVIPLVAGEVVNRNRGRVAGKPAARLMLGSAVGLIGAFQIYAWWYDVAHVTGARGALDFYNHAIYIAPLGWHFWAVLAILGAAALIALATSEALRGISLRTTPSLRPDALESPRR